MNSRGCAVRREPGGGGGGRRAKKGAVEGRGLQSLWGGKEQQSGCALGTMFKERLGCESCVRQSVLHRQALPQSCRRKRGRETAHVRPSLWGSVAGTGALEKHCHRPGSWHGPEELSTLTPSRREGLCSRDLPGILLSSPRPVFINISPTSPIYPWAFISASPTAVTHSPVLASPLPSLDPLTSWAGCTSPGVRTCREHPS